MYLKVNLDYIDQVQMIDSSLFSRSTVFKVQDLPESHVQTESHVLKSIVYHMVQSFIKTINQDQGLSKQQKFQSAFEFGFQMGNSFAEQQSYGYVKYFISKNDKQAKPFLAEMKLLNSRIWPAVFASSCKLFAVLSDSSASSYKLEDSDFSMTKFLWSTNSQNLREYIKLVHEFAKGTVWGFLDKMNLNAEINFVQSNDNKIALEIKNITKKIKLEGL